MQKSKSIQNIEEHMGRLEPGSFRYKTLESAKNFKRSWIELGQHLYAVYKDKMFKDWGYLTFEAYCGKEIGVRQTTAVKLLKSYFFLEKEEPDYLKEQALESQQPREIPSFEAVNALRLAKQSSRIDEEDYEELREDVLQNAKEEGEVKKKIRYILKSAPGKIEEPEEKRRLFLKRLATYMQTTKNEMVACDAPAKIQKKVDELLEVLQDYLK